MVRKKPPYAPEFRQRMIELVRAGRTPEDASDAMRKSDGIVREASHFGSNSLSFCRPST